MEERKDKQLEIAPGSVSDETSGQGENKSTTRRAFAAGLATLGAAGLLATTAEAKGSGQELKSKLLARINADADDRQPVEAPTYTKAGGLYTK